jgi:hypothetical protein
MQSNAERFDNIFWAKTESKNNIFHEKVGLNESIEPSQNTYINRQ